MTTEQVVSLAPKEDKDWPSVMEIADGIRSMIHSGTLAAGSKLLPEKQLAESFSVTVHTIRKVVRVLRDEGYLFSRPKFGVFVTAFQQDSDSTGLLNPVQPAHIHFVTQSNLPKQRRLVMSAIDLFKASVPLGEPQLGELLMTEDKEHFYEVPPESDIMEMSCPFYYHQFRQDFVEVKKYFSESLKAVDDDPYSVPFYYSTTYVCYRRDLLDRLGLGVPSWQTYDQQIDYLEKVTKASLDSGLNVPGTTFTPMLLLDSAMTGMFRDFHDDGMGTEAFVKRYREPFRRCTSYWQRHRISEPLQADLHIHEFLTGMTPLVFTGSSTVLDIREHHPDCEFETYPYLTLDDRLSRLTVPLSIFQRTSMLVECVRFLRILQSEPIQRQAAALGYVPIESSCMSSLPLPCHPFEVADPQFFTTAEECYIGLDIINVELWNVILFDKPLEEALRDTFMFARAYLDFRLDARKRVE